MSKVNFERRWLDYRGTLIPEIRGGAEGDALTAEELALIGDGGGTEETAPEWANEIQDADLKTALSKFDTEQKFLDALGFELTIDSDNWRNGLPDELKETAEKFTSNADAIRAIEAFRKRESQVRVPGKDATEAEKQVYLKAVGIPDSPEGYEFPALPEGEELTDEIKTSRQAWAKRFHDLHVPKETAKQLSQALNEEVAAQAAAQKEADEAFAKSQDDALRTEWKGDELEKNKTLARRAVIEIANRAGLNIDDVSKIENKDGKFVFDSVPMKKMFAVIGREMAEGTLGPTLTDTERETLDEQLVGIRKQQTEAQAEGNTRRANTLFAQEQALIAKMKGNQPIVGSGARVA